MSEGGIYQFLIGLLGLFLLLVFSTDTELYLLLMSLLGLLEPTRDFCFKHW